MLGWVSFSTATDQATHLWEAQPYTYLFQVSYGSAFEHSSIALSLVMPFVDLVLNHKGSYGARLTRRGYENSTLDMFNRA